VHSEADRESLACEMADESVCIGPASSERISTSRYHSAAEISGADAITRNGFLSEHYFATSANRVTSISSPSKEAIERHGIKPPRAAMRKAEFDVPVREPVTLDDPNFRAREEIAIPYRQSVAGGGGAHACRRMNPSVPRSKSPKRSQEARNGE